MAALEITVYVILYFVAGIFVSVCIELLLQKDFVFEDTHRIFMVCVWPLAAILFVGLLLIYLDRYIVWKIQKRNTLRSGK